MSPLRSHDTEQILTALIEGTASATGDRFFSELVRVLAQTLGTKYAFVSELADPGGEMINLLSIWDGDDYGDPIEYSAKGTPCEEVIRNGIQLFPGGVQGLFPEDELLVELCIESYLAIPLYDPAGQSIGHLGVMDVKPLPESERASSVLRVLAARAGAELARIKADRRIRELNDDLERRVEARTAELLEANNRLRQEIEERALVQAALDTRQKQFRLVSDSLPVFITYVDHRGRYLFNNRAYEQLVGLPREEILERPIDEVLGKEMYTVIRPHVEAALEGHGGLYEDTVVGPDGIRHTFRSRYVPHLAEDGSVAGFFVLAEDVTDEVEALETLQRLRQELAHALRTKTLGELTAAIAHELNQPLASIRTNAQAAQRMVHTGQVSCDDIDEILSDIVADNHRAAEVIARLRALLTRGEVESQDLELNQIVEQVERLVRQDALIRNVSLRFDLADDLPVVEGDPIQLQQVLLNLIINGFEAMDGLPADRERSLTVITERSGNSAVAVTVADSGKGFEGMDLSSIFEPFKTTKEDGLGMGLAISRSIIESQHGRIEALPRNGNGAMVRFVLPAAGLESGDGVAIQALNVEEA